VILLDTNAISEIMRPAPDADFMRWINSQPNLSIWTTAINIYEIRAGLKSMSIGRKRFALNAFFDRWIAEVLRGRIANFDEAAAECAAELAAGRRAKGFSIEARDTMIAGIVLANRATLATRNVKHFADIARSVVNPWEAR
jgi:predicted nucleic acid-binding protein